jgi:hypothetical protein
VIQRIGRRFRRAREGERGHLRAAYFAQRVPKVAPAIDKLRKAKQEVFKDCRRFAIFARLNEHHASQESRLRPIGGEVAGALQPNSRLGGVTRRARRARSRDQRWRMIRAQRQTGIRPAQSIIDAPTLERDCRSQLMRRRVIWS